ncbi:hypothetical protein DN062_13810 [Nitrincola tibetensis]|uniref:YjiS-like domain-containing protein n=1 Tax=Nitrincola tibetensis TaxID=2219697 RepID=A0A364NJP4_9GAMM|nr:DUF1127 domain-containing protein [Nitrincola tibetensis]RAU17240.1 hypothetical protein DN062_13810 [Nitrincola tibetensis]
MQHFNLTQLCLQLRDYRAYRRSHRQLLALEERLLKDVGITRSQAQDEGKEPIWKRSLFKKHVNKDC